MYTYDIAIIGGGISGLMLAYDLIKSEKNYKIVIIEKGNHISNRNCPVISNKNATCVKCNPCSIMNGFAGAGAFSDGKFIITTEYGGWISEYLEPGIAIHYMEKADQILKAFGATDNRYVSDDDLKQLCLQNGLHIKSGIVKHLGTENMLEIMKRLIEAISASCHVMPNSEVFDVDKNNHEISFVNQNRIRAEKIIFAVGRSGSNFFIDWCKKNNIHMSNNAVDIGVRVELPSLIWRDICSKVYDPKISYRSKKYGDETRMFCFNDRGAVVTENTDGVITVNGHAYENEMLKTENSNFALLSSIKFTEPFNKPIEYLKHIAGIANFISNGNTIVQRYGDLLNGKRTTDTRLNTSTVKPTLQAIPGDLSLCLPKRQLDNIVETIEQLNKIAPGTANYDTLLHGVECKFYSAKPEMNNFELSGCKDIYACGDGAGVTRSLAQAAANGLYLASII